MTHSPLRISINKRIQVSQLSILSTKSLQKSTLTSLSCIISLSLQIINGDNTSTNMVIDCSKNTKTMREMYISKSAPLSSTSKDKSKMDFKILKDILREDKNLFPHLMEGLPPKHRVQLSIQRQRV